MASAKGPEWHVSLGLVQAQVQLEEEYHCITVVSQSFEQAA